MAIPMVMGLIVFLGRYDIVHHRMHGRPKIIPLC